MGRVVNCGVDPAVNGRIETDGSVVDGAFKHVPEPIARGLLPGIPADGVVNCGFDIEAHLRREREELQAQQAAEALGGHQ